MKVELNCYIANIPMIYRGYKITIKLDDPFGKVAEDFEMIKEMDVDIKLIKVLLEEIVPEIREIRRLFPGLGRNWRK